MTRTVTTRIAAVGICALGLLVASSAVAAKAAPRAGQTKKFDPFEKKLPPKPKTAIPVVTATQVQPPPFSERLKSCATKTSVLGQTAGSTPCPYLVSELKISGVFEGDTPGAFAVATPTNETIFIKAGDRLYDGVVVAVHEGTVSDPASVDFTQITTFKEKGGTKQVRKTVTLAAP